MGFSVRSNTTRYTRWMWWDKRSEYTEAGMDTHTKVPPYPRHKPQTQPQNPKPAHTTTYPHQTYSPQHQSPNLNSDPSHPSHPSHLGPGSREVVFATGWLQPNTANGSGHFLLGEELYDYSNDDGVDFDAYPIGRARTHMRTHGRTHAGTPLTARAHTHKHAHTHTHTPHPQRCTHAFAQIALRHAPSHAHAGHANLIGVASWQAEIATQRLVLRSFFRDGNHSAAFGPGPAPTN